MTGQPREMRAGAAGRQRRRMGVLMDALRVLNTETRLAPHTLSRAQWERG